MKSVVYKVLTWVILPLCIIGLLYLIVSGIRKPLTFEKQKAAREAVAIQRLKDIRTIQLAFKTESGHYASTVDSLKTFYESGTIVVKKQYGSQDDSVAVENTEAIKKALKKSNPRITPAEITKELVKRAEANERIVCVTDQKIAVKDTLFNSRENFVIDSIFIIPFCGQPVQMNTVIRQVSGVQVPLFEAKMPYRMLLYGLDHQQIVNLVSSLEDNDKFQGLMVGSVDQPNNNAGNWE